MKTYTIRRISATEVLDSRGDPTLKATVFLSNGVAASASVPSGASTGSHEARELRDGGRRYGGKGVRRAVRNVNTAITRSLAGNPVDDQQGIDRRLVALDGTPQKSRLGANALLAASLACARAGSVARGLPLYRYLRETFGLPKPRTFPSPMCNILNGGRHADNGISFQEYMVVAERGTFRSRLERVSGVVRALRRKLKDRGERVAVGDEGGFAPLMASNEEGLKLLADAVRAAGYRLGKDVSLALDVAASEFFDAKRRVYRLLPERRTLDGQSLTRYYARLVSRYRLRSIEDPCDEDDWGLWKRMTDESGDRVMIVGDDLFVTKAKRLARGITLGAANAILVKPNQVGTLTETMETIAAAQAGGYKVIVSNRSGETCDDFIADLAVAVGSVFLKAGALARGERLAKYNRLLEIAQEVGA